MINTIFISALLYLAGRVSCFEICKDVEIVNRDSWGARSPSSVNSFRIFPLQHIFIAHTVTPQCYNISSCSRRLKSMQKYHMDHLGWSDIGYGFFIGGDGRVYEAAGWRKASIHTRGWNDKSLGISFIGDFRKEEPSPEMLQAARTLIACGKDLRSLSEVYEVHGSRDGTCSDSPGDALYNAIKSWPEFKGGRLPGYTC